MPSIPGFWDVGPHDPLSVESTVGEAVALAGGSRVDALVPEPRAFANADFIFPSAGVVAELKEIETEFASIPKLNGQFELLLQRLMVERPSWRPALFCGSENNYPDWFHTDWLRLFRPPISRILKKANKQIRETKAHFGIASHTGVLLLVNDGFTALGPDLVRSLAASLLTNSYSSIDCLVYMTVNRYVEIRGSDAPRLIWVTAYSDRSDDALASFIDALGKIWFDHLESRIGPFTEPRVVTSNDQLLRGAVAIRVPPGAT